MSSIHPYVGDLATVPLVPTLSDKERARRRRHHNFMSIYWCVRQAWVEAAELATAAYDAEMEEYKATYPPPLFKNYLIETAGQPR